MASDGHQRYRVGGEGVGPSGSDPGSSPTPQPGPAPGGTPTARPTIRIGPTPTAAGAATAPPRRKSRLVPALAWTYALLMLGLAWLVLWAKPEIWPVHAFLYSPRWVMAAPLALLLPMIAWTGAWSSLTAVAAAALALIPITGLNLPIGSGPAAPVIAGAPGTLRVLSGNVLAQHTDLQRLTDLIGRMSPDVVVFQECSAEVGQAALKALGAGWHAESESEHFVASRYPISDFQTLRRTDVNWRILGARATLQTPEGPVPLASVHPMTPRDGLSALIRSPLTGAREYARIFAEQQTESDQLAAWLAEAPPTLIVAGDFNLTVEHPVYQAHWSGLGNAFTSVGWGLGHTKFTRYHGTRIDHVLYGPAWQALQCEVGPDIGSDHRPVLVVLARRPAPER